MFVWEPDVIVNVERGERRHSDRVSVMEFIYAKCHGNWYENRHFSVVLPNLSSIIFSAQVS